MPIYYLSELLYNYLIINILAMDILKYYVRDV